MNTPALARFAWPPLPLQGATPVARRSRFHGVLALGTQALRVQSHDNTQ